MTKVVLGGDLHLGQGGISPESIYNIIKEHWKFKPVILMGDLIDCGIDRGMQFDNSIQPQDQLRWVKRIADELDIKSYCIGNHDDRIYKATGINIYESFLGKPRHRITIDDVKFYFTHGKSAAENPWNEHNKLLRFVDADVIAIGHSHVLGKLDVMRDNGRVTLLRTGSFARDLRYAIEAHYPPTVCGWAEYDCRTMRAHLFMIKENEEVVEI